jgi:hypothetical protein
MRRTRRQLQLLVLALVGASSCSRDGGSSTAPQDPPLPTALLKDIVIASLPAPFYHFEYDATGRMTFASFASELTRYDLSYTAGRLSEMRNNILVNHDRLVYAYDVAGRVAEVRYVDDTGVVFTRVHYGYDGGKLIGVERERKTANGFIVDRTMSLSYGADGNLLDLTEHYLAIPGIQDEAVFTDHYEQYDTGINVDDFSLLHDEFFDHLVLLPQVRLQMGNPGRVTRSGDGLNYHVEYSYTYDGTNRPLTKSGDLTILNGSTAGQHVQTSSVFSYY